MKRHPNLTLAMAVFTIVLLGIYIGSASGKEKAFTEGRQSGTVAASEITEASGIIASRKHDLLWVHNDSGDIARVFGISTSGSLLCTCRLEGVTAVDWEDMAIGPGPEPGKDYLYLADIGDNDRKRTSVTIYRIPEPAAPAGDMVIPSNDIRALNVTYPDGPQNAETLLSDPETGDLLIVTKNKKGKSRIFRYPFTKQNDPTVQVEQIASLAFGKGDLPGSPLATGGDISPSGTGIIIKTYDHAFLWERSKKGIAETFSAKPASLPLKTEPQGEAVCFSADGGSYYTLSEGGAQPLWRYDQK